MPDDWTMITCPHCSGEFKAPATLEVGEEIACPACGEEIGKGSAGFPGAGPSTGLPEQKKSVELEIPEMVIADANPLSGVTGLEAEEEEEGPRLENIGRLASTADIEPLAPGGAESGEAGERRRRMLREHDRVDMVGWDDAEGEAKQRKSVTTSMKFLVLIALPLVLLAAIFALISRPRSRTAPEALPPAAAGVTAEDPHDDLGLLSVVPLMEEIGLTALHRRSLKLMEAFLDAPDLETRIKHCLHPARVRPLMERYYETRDPGPFEHRGLPQATGTFVNGAYVNLVVATDSIQRSLVLLRSPTDQDQLVIDWEAFVGYNPVSFAQLAEEQGDEPVQLRVLASLTDYYNFGFTDAEYLSVRMEEPFSSKVLYGYVGKETPLAAAISNRLGGTVMQAVALKVRVPIPPRGPDQVMIEELVDPTWTIIPSS